MSKTYKPVLTDTIDFAANIEMKYFIGFDGALCAAGAKALGVSLRSTLSGEPGPVGVLGIFPVIAGGAITKGAAVTSDSSGRAVAAASLAVETEVETTVDTAVETTVDTTVETTVTVTVPEGATPVTSTAAQPDLSESASSTATSTGTSTATNTLSGGVLPVAINGYALDAASQAGDEIRVVRLS